jgi:hypothetical protein
VDLHVASSEDHVGATGGVHGDSIANVFTTAPEESGVDEQRRAGRIELRHEGVSAAVVSGIEGPKGRREVARPGVASHVGVTGGVHGDVKAMLLTTVLE